jgi:LemA protein
MKNRLRVIWIVLAVLVFAVFINVIGGYNSLVRSDVAIEEAYANVANRLNERQATIAQLLPVVAGLADHEQAILDSINAARAAYAAANATGNIDGMIQADAMTVESLTNLLVVVENYPTIAADAAFLDLMVTISGIESALYVARRDFNEAVASYNASVRLFPKVLIARMFQFDSSVEYWKLSDGAEEIPVIDFGAYDD